MRQGLLPKENGGKINLYVRLYRTEKTKKGSDSCCIRKSNLEGTKTREVPNHYTYVCTRADERLVLLQSCFYTRLAVTEIEVRQEMFLNLTAPIGGSVQKVFPTSLQACLLHHLH